VVMHNDVDLISETYEDIATGKLQIRRLPLPRSFDECKFSRKSLLIYKSETRIIDLLFAVDIV